MRRFAILALLTLLPGTMVTAAGEPAGEAEQGGTAAASGAPPMVNARLEARVGGDLAAAVRAVPSSAGDVTWIGYRVPAAGGGTRCCWNTGDDAGSCCWGCRLERDGAVPTTTAAVAATGVQPVALEPADTVTVLIRVAAGAVERIRTFSPSCVVDAGGRTVVWLSGVTPETSASWLHAQFSAGRRRLDDDVLAAVAAHASPRALDILLAEARSGSTTHRRGQALFWLAQRAGDRAVGAINEAIDRDPDTEVKRKAVFALSQLPDGDGVPRLIEVARTHSNTAVRKQAFFWLGQSHDPRALAFFADVLKR